MKVITENKKVQNTEFIHIMSGLRFSREDSCDQKSGIEPRFCTTELICTGCSSETSSNTTCSVSTSLATLPFSFTPRFRYLDRQEKSKVTTKFIVSSAAIRGVKLDSGLFIKSAADYMKKLIKRLNQKHLRV
jgi:hypothetical protein